MAKSARNTAAGGAKATPQRWLRMALGHPLHFGQLAESGIELAVLFLRRQFFFVVECVRPPGNCAAERNSTTDLEQLNERHSDDNSTHADAVACNHNNEIGLYGVVQPMAARCGTTNCCFALPANDVLSSGGRRWVRVELTLRSCEEMSPASFCGACGHIYNYKPRIAAVP